MSNAAAFFVDSRFSSQLEVMLRMQNEMNLIVAPDWDKRGFAWHRAIYVEAGEFLEHLSTWKWWKKGTPDFPQANMELVDIWHFALSWYIERFGQPLGSDSLNIAITRRVAQAARQPHVGLDAAAEAEARHVEVDNLVRAAGDRRFDTLAFVRLLGLCGMNFDLLFERYVGKNMLNRFRQEHGYKAGTYVKVWDGLEDNVHLDQILEAATTDSVSADALPSYVRQHLGQRYAERTSA